MKTLKITLALLAVLLLTVSVVETKDIAVNTDEATYKEYSPKDMLAIDRKKLKMETQA
ncbi:hypothetical protein [Winogradskyella wichelsiae]|uniref:hypothetical protein n=1 Tax=Winogradskyella wichelsiae TaxID=2697007 RepID=UPI003EF10078